MSLKTITKIEVQQRRKDRCSLYLDDEYAFGIDQEIVLKFGLKNGLQLSDHEIDDILLSEEKKRAKERALNFLSYRDRSEKEVFDKLKSLNYDIPIIEWVIQELKRLQLLDDKRFAVSLARTKIAAKAMGEYLLRRELASKGLHEEDIAYAIENVYQEEDQRSLATHLTQKQMRKNKDADAKKTKKRISDFLLRRGFSWDIVAEIMEDIRISE